MGGEEEPHAGGAHEQRICYDPIYHRIWLCTGDQANTALYYSDDMGESWTFVTGSDDYQATGIIALDDSILLGSDAPPNGVWRIERTGKFEMPVLNPNAFNIDEDIVITSVFQFPFRRSWGDPVYSYTRADSAGDGPAGVVATVDGTNFYEVLRTTEEFATGGVNWALGPTASGKIVMWVSPGKIWTAEALDWK